MNLLLLENGNGDVHYAWIKKLSRLLYGQKGHRHGNKQLYCDTCLRSFNKDETLKKQSDFALQIAMHGNELNEPMEIIS